MTKAKHRTFFNIFLILTLFLFFFLLKSPVQASNAVYNGVMLCLTKVIPSLFPFLVLNELMLSLGVTRRLGHVFGNLLSKLFNIEKETAVSFICGCLFGFPLGTRSVVSLYEKGFISKEEAEKAICFCSNTGPAFIIGVVGVSLCNKKIGICIYFSQILSAILIGLKKRNSTPLFFSKSSPKKDEYFSISKVTKAISDSVLPLLNICAFVCFFSCISGALDNLFSTVGMNEYASFFITGFLEITNGIQIAESYGANFISVFFSAFFVGWSGVSVILQSMSVCSKTNINTKKFIASKLLQGIICAILSVILCKIFKLY